MNLKKIQALLRPILLPFSISYSSLMRMRAFLYRNEILPSWKPPKPCISVGNISIGGTGKTSLCVWIINWLSESDLTPVLLTRGYKAKPPFLPFLVKEDSKVEQAGDEPLMLKMKCKEAHILVDPDRVRAGIWALENLNPDIFILDDGFQHLKVKRDIDLVLLSSKDIAKNRDFILPAGTRREGWESLKRADAFLINIYPEEFIKLEKDIKKLLLFKKPVFSFYLDLTSLIKVKDWSVYPLRNLRNVRFIAVSGLGNPEKFEKTINRFTKKSPIKHLIFPDHKKYSKKDWANIKKEAEKTNANLVICSLKDAVKLKTFADDTLYGLNFEIKFGPFLYSEEKFPFWLKRKLFL